MDFRGKVVVITGGSRGLGLEMARALAAEGARLAIWHAMSLNWTRLARSWIFTAAWCAFASWKGATTCRTRSNGAYCSVLSGPALAGSSTRVLAILVMLGSVNRLKPRLPRSLIRLAPSTC